MLRIALVLLVLAGAAYSLLSGPFARSTVTVDNRSGRDVRDLAVEFATGVTTVPLLRAGEEVAVEPPEWFSTSPLRIASPDLYGGESVQVLAQVKGRGAEITVVLERDGRVHGRVAMETSFGF